MEYAMIRYTYLCNVGMCAFFVGIFLIAISTTDDLKNDLKSINENVKMKQNSLHSIIKQLCGFIDLQVSAKQLGFFFHFQRFLLG